MARKTKQEALETRERILDAAETLFQRRGVSRTSLQDVAQQAEVTRGAIYWHFKDKAELFDAMMQRGTMPLEEGVSLHAPPAEALSLAELRWGLVNVFYCAMHNERTRRVFEIAMQKVEYTGEMQALHERKQGARRTWREQNKAAFDRAVAQGQLPTGLDTQGAAIALVSMVDGLLHQWISDPDSFDLLAVGSTVVDNFLTSLGRAAGPSLLPPMSAAELARLGQQAVCSLGTAPPSPAATASENHGPAD
ncbi:TetR family transcriptional regulator [Roseateles violae]|uniref:TetR family transcriptional regulator n=1 Tax=Roseateles violae TaxID=3058042 RepID=A0ABT8DY56_9BURK|nr:TetR family transcriptional regulator [Pelomonas sp. PFR6]MDN3922579.1 TetR family transcriptional regulator [Pelomonas sp. PFR6]